MFDRFSSVVLSLLFRPSTSDHSVFVRHSGTIVLIVYLDDILLSGDDSAGIVDLKRYLGQQFHTKDLGALRYFLGIEVARSSRGISLFQRKYVLDLLSETGFLGARPVDTPMDSPLSLMLIMAIPFLMWAGIDVWLGNGFISLLLVLWKKKESNGTRPGTKKSWVIISPGLDHVSRIV